jgi:hypothetical protein
MFRLKKDVIRRITRKLRRKLLELQAGVRFKILFQDETSPLVLRKQIHALNQIHTIPVPINLTHDSRSFIFHILYIIIHL